jgi:hypothetical protein
VNRNLPSLFRPLALAGLALSFLGAAPARAVDRDFQEWTLFAIQGPLSDRWLAYFELQPRFADNAAALERLLVRPAIGYKLRHNVSLWQGYLYNPQFFPATGREHRPFQQLLIETKAGRTGLINRTRLEERLIHGVDGTSVRFRHMFRFSHPISRDRRWALVGYDEFFFNLNSTDNGPQSGFDQNRLYFGLSRQVNKEVRVEAGYIWNYINQRGQPDRSLNILFTGVTVSL